MKRRAFTSLLAFFGIAPAAKAQDVINMGSYPNGKCPVCFTSARPAPKNVSAPSSQSRLGNDYDRHPILPCPIIIPAGGYEWFIEDCQKCGTLFKVKVK